MQLDQHAALQACFGEQQIAATGATANTKIAGARSDLIECGANVCHRCFDFCRRETRWLGFICAAIGRVIDHVTAKYDDAGRLQPLFGTTADQSMELLLGAIDDGGDFGNAFTSEFQLTKEIELLA